MKTITVHDAVGKEHTFDGDDFSYQLTPQNQLFIRHKTAPDKAARQGSVHAVFIEPIWMKIDAE